MDPRRARERRVGFTTRVVALLTDLVAVLLLATVVGRIVGGGWTPEMIDPPRIPGTDLPIQQQSAMEGTIILTVVALLYFLIEVLTGGSPGKMILGLRVGTWDGRPAPPVTLALRYVLKTLFFYLMLLSALASFSVPGAVRVLQTLAFLSIGILGLGYFLTAGGRRQGYHDVLVATAVYRKRDLERED